MAEVMPRDILLRVGGRTLQRYGVLCWAGSNRADEFKETFSRADASTCATYIDRDGIARLAAANVPRIEWVDLDGDGIRETPGILLEGSRTNGWTKSEKIDDAVWTKDFLTGVTPNVGRGMDGLSTADLIVEDGTNNLHGFERQPPAMTDNTQQSVSVYAAYFGTRLWFRIRTVDKSGALNSTWFNIGAGTIGTVGAGHTDVKIEGPLGTKGAQGYRCSLSFNSAAGATTPVVQFFMATGDNSGAYAGDGTSGMVFSDVMFETDKAFRGSYIATDAATVTRAADSFTVPFNFGPFDLSVLVRLARPVWADAVGDIGISPGVFTLGLRSAGSLESAGGKTSRTLSIEQWTDNGHSVSQAPAIPAGANLTYVGQYKNLKTAPQVAEDIGSGLSGFSSTNLAMPTFGSQTLTLSGGAGTFGVLIDLILARDLHTLAEMLAIP